MFGIPCAAYLMCATASVLHCLALTKNLHHCNRSADKNLELKGKL